MAAWSSESGLDWSADESRSSALADGERARFAIGVCVGMRDAEGSIGEVRRQILCGYGSW